MLYSIPNELYYVPDEMSSEARIMTAMAAVLKDWIYEQSAAFLAYLNTGDINIKKAIIGDIIKHGRGSFNPHVVIAMFDNVLEEYMSHDDEDDTTAEGIPHRTHETSDGYRDGMKSGDVIRSIETPFGTVTERLL